MILGAEAAPAALADDPDLAFAPEDDVVAGPGEQEEDQENCIRP